MGTWDSMYTAMSGMNANSLAISVVGDNLANLNTAGYKATRATFQDVLGQTLIGAMGSRRLGQGVSLKSLDQIHSQGGFQATGNVLDMAISGNGFFLVRDAAAGAEADFYTRAGQFLLDAQGNVVTPAGMRLQGYMADAEGVMGPALTDINLTGVEMAAHATEEVDLDLHLTADTQGIDTAATPFDPADDATYHHQTSFTVYDSLGQAQTVNVYFTKNLAGEWEWNARIGDTDVTPAGNNVLSFDTDGNLVGGQTASIVFDPPNGAAQGQTIALDFAGTTMSAGSWGVRTQRQDGYAGGALETITVGEDGVITGTFDNGRSRDLARVALATFDNVQGLERRGGNLWSRSPASGEPIVAGAGESGRGLVVASHLEASNVDLTQEFVNLIAAQRGFQASSRTITTVDQLLSETVNLKR